MEKSLPPPGDGDRSSKQIPQATLQFKLSNIFSLLMFVAGNLACLLHFSMFKTFVINVVVSIAIALLNSRAKNLIIASALTGGSFVATLILVVYLFLWTEYLFFYKGARPYFIDGTFEEGLIYPCIYLTVYVPIGAVIGAFSACPLLLVNWIRQSLQLY